MSEQPSSRPRDEAPTSRLTGHGGLLAAATLSRLGVDTLFTLSGGHLFPLYDGWVKEGLRLIDVRHEQSAVFAAEGWAKVTRRPGVAALTAGPGVTNGISAITTAHFTGSPILVLGGRAPAGRWGQGSLQELDHVPIVESVCKSASTCSQASEIPQRLGHALRDACAPHRGPCFVDLPLDVVFGQGEGELPDRADVIESAPIEPDPDASRIIGRLLAEAERPVVMAGADVYWEGAEQELRRLCEEAGCPVFLNGLGRGSIPADHPLAFSRARGAAFKEGDLVIVVGTPLDFRLAFGRFGEAGVVHVADRAERVATHVELAAGLGGSLRLALEGILDACLEAGPRDRSRWLDRLRGEEEARREKERSMLSSDADPIHPGRVYGELRARLDRDAIVIGDGGDFVSYAGKLIDTYTPGCFLDPGPYGCLGTGPGYALGAKLAHPDRQVVLMLGDGAAGFSLGDLDTLARFELPVVVVVGNNGCWGLEKHPMQQLFGYHVAAELSRATRYDQVAAALGGGGERVERAQDIGAALDRAFDARTGPYLVEVLTDPADAYPRSSNLA
ncbi:MAG TPA: acetolactate synthase [Thermoanaerobaculia bacterium]|nr:acetolactate synthase [Thermoanaerobaculia bacterium]